MSWITQVWIWGRTVLTAIAAAFTARPAGPLLSAINVRLLADATVSLTPDTTIAALAAHESAYSGYAPVVVGSWSAVRTRNGEASLGTALFVATTASPFVQGLAVGYWLDDGTDVIGAEYFADGIVATFTAPGSFLGLDLLLPAVSPQTP